MAKISEQGAVELMLKRSLEGGVRRDSYKGDVVEKNTLGRGFSSRG